MTPDSSVYIEHIELAFIPTSIAQFVLQTSLGFEYKECHLVCYKDNDEPYDPGYISRNFLRQMTKIITELNICKIKFHDLRHTHLALLLLSGTTAKVVSERLGHSSIIITLDTYSRILPYMQGDSAVKLNNLTLNSPMAPFVSEFITNIFFIITIN
ncbi:tyrosine-type recombinase/integrase [Clostridium sp.]|uniref:tyrosine-type recombinase/integrase n=1 Tax=Clostridium sp. TaxID=1506 RepID=UPI003D6D9850